MSLLQFLVCSSQATGGIALMQGVDAEEYDDQHQSNTCAYEALMGQVGLVACDFCLLALRVVYGSQLRYSAVFLSYNSRVQQDEEI